jgi:hypothetical protein
MRRLRELGRSVRATTAHSEALDGRGFSSRWGTEVRERTARILLLVAANFPARGSLLVNPDLQITSMFAFLVCSFNDTMTI